MSDTSSHVCRTRSTNSRKSLNPTAPSSLRSNLASKSSLVVDLPNATANSKKSENPNVLAASKTGVGRVTLPRSVSRPGVCVLRINITGI